MSHRAFAFDEASFRSTLRSALFAALEDGEPEALAAFVKEKDDPSCDHLGPIELAERALETFYDPTEDIGLGSDVAVARAALDQAYPEGIAFLTGAILPLHGWFVQSSETVAKHLPMVESAAHRDALNHEILLRVASMLRSAQGRGLLVKG